MVLNWLISIKVKRAQLRGMSKTMLYSLFKEASKEIENKYGIIYYTDFKKDKEALIDDIYKCIKKAIENKYE